MGVDPQFERRGREESQEIRHTTEMQMVGHRRSSLVALTSNSVMATSANAFFPSVGVVAQTKESGPVSIPGSFARDH